MTCHHETSLDISDFGKHAVLMTHTPYTLVARTQPIAVSLTCCRWLDFARPGAALCSCRLSRFGLPAPPPASPTVKDPGAQHALRDVTSAADRGYPYARTGSGP